MQLLSPKWHALSGRLSSRWVVSPLVNCSWCSLLPVAIIVLCIFSKMSWFMGVQVGLGRLQFHMAKHQGVRVFVTAEIKLSSLLPKRLTVLGAELRPRTKRLLYAEVEKTVWPAIGAGKVKPKLIQVFTVVTSSRSS
ncbi:uncharacterized protein LOC130498446 isoform X2 [Raphanus sativus]|uniref:Uncharacterized protein LOC130498446 isoform X2 n=1 Tax=Raphanus sativus TaxID=3726 RepID=A0A9W3C8A6_RAPSA|nr:uncharacterized protein LOC130498446 isoform X2 [Raphanus sativus]